MFNRIFSRLVHYLKLALAKAKIYSILVAKKTSEYTRRTFSYFKNLAVRLFDFLYSAVIFQIYFVLSFIVCGYSTDRIWGKDGSIADTGGIHVGEIDNIWTDHYYWYFFSVLASCIVGGGLLGITIKRVSKWKTGLAFLPNSVFLLSTVSIFTYNAYNSQLRLFSDDQFPFIAANALLLIVCNIAVYFSARFSHDIFTSSVKFSKYHFLWLSIPYTFYFAGFIYALSIHLVFLWHDLKISFHDEFNFSLKHILRGILDRLLLIPEVFKYLIEIIIDLLISLALNVWRYPIEYTLKFLNGDFLKEKPRFKSSMIIFCILLFGVPLAAVVELLCYYLLILVDKIF